MEELIGGVMFLILTIILGYLMLGYLIQKITCTALVHGGLYPKENIDIQTEIVLTILWPFIILSVAVGVIGVLGLYLFGKR